MLTVSVTDHFDAAHHLTNVEEGHPCGRVHGHTYKVTIELGGGTQTMVMDFLEASEMLDLALMRYDHLDLNDILSGQPTVEVLMVDLVEHLDPMLSEGVTLVGVKIAEGPHGQVTWTP